MTPRKGEDKLTIAGTSMSKIIGELLDKFKEEKQKDFPTIKLSRPKIVEIAVYKLLDDQGVLVPWLEAKGYSDSQVKNIKQYLLMVT